MFCFVRFVFVEMQKATILKMGWQQETICTMEQREGLRRQLLASHQQIRDLLLGLIQLQQLKLSLLRQSKFQQLPHYLGSLNLRIMRSPCLLHLEVSFLLAVETFCFLLLIFAVSLFCFT
jgi:hypothetical protein